MSAPRIEIDLRKITQNARVLVRRLSKRGIAVTGVTKAVCGHPDVANAMLDSGVVGLAESRLSNVIRMRAAGIQCSISMIRAPMIDEAKDVIRCCGASYNTEKSTILKLGAFALEERTEHHVILTVEMGDLREGILPEDLVNAAALVVATPGLALRGIAANFACMSNEAPTAMDMALLSRLADQIEGECGPYVALVSAGGSASLNWALGNHAMGRINNMRLGEAILLGVDPVSGKSIQGLHTDAFTLFVEVIEARHKPNSMPTRPGPLEYGKLELVTKIDQRNRAVLAIGRQDTDVSGLAFPLGIAFIDATSDHTVVDIGKVNVSVGSEMMMRMNYSALMQAMSAQDIEKVLRHEPPVTGIIKDSEAKPVLKLV